MSGKLSLEQFKIIVTDAVLVALDLIITDEDKKVLVGRRQNAPAKGFLFVPGGRVFKGEALSAALTRISREEIGVELEMNSVRLHGIYEHVYSESFFEEPNLTTHYVVIACAATLPASACVLNDQQHDALQFMPVGVLINRSDVHQFTKNYFLESADNAFLSGNLSIARQCSC